MWLLQERVKMFKSLYWLYHEEISDDNENTKNDNSLTCAGVSNDDVIQIGNCDKYSDLYEPPPEKTQVYNLIFNAHV